MKKSGLAKAGYDNAKGLLDILREMGETAAALWWRFFDWLAQVEWRKLIIIWLLLMLFAMTPFGLPEQTTGFILLSLASRCSPAASARPKSKRATPPATPTRKAWNGAWWRRAWRRCRRRWSRIFCSTPWR